jgi:hypothetical protein
MDNSVKVSKAAIISAANGMMFMTSFGALWSSVGIIGSHGYASPWLLIICGLVTLVMMLGSFTLFHKSRNFNNNIAAADQTHWKKVNKKFMIVFVLEGAAIAIASVICNVYDSFELFFPITAIIVGVHFFPLAKLFRVNFYHLTGFILCVLGITAFFIPLNVTVSGETLVARSMFIGFGSAVTLWATGFTIWMTTRKQ